jgi:putative membrane protein
MEQVFPAAKLNTPEPLAKRIIWSVSGVVFLAVVLLNRIQLPAPAGFDVHIFALANAIINSAVSVLLALGVASAKVRNWRLHRQLMMSAIILSALFLVSYILHHLFAGDTPYGGTGFMRVIYYAVLFTHIPLAAITLPFILLTAYRALKADHPAHRRLARRVWPVWFYVSVSGVAVYLMISPFY